jgi:hypothetical protein
MAVSTIRVPCFSPINPHRSKGPSIGRSLLRWVQIAQEPALHDLGLHRVGKFSNGLEELRPFKTAKTARINATTDGDRFSGCTFS